MRPRDGLEPDPATFEEWKKAARDCMNLSHELGRLKHKIDSGEINLVATSDREMVANMLRFYADQLIKVPELLR